MPVFFWRCLHSCLLLRRLSFNCVVRNSLNPFCISWNALHPLQSQRFCSNLVKLWHALHPLQYQRFCSNLVKPWHGLHPKFSGFLLYLCHLLTCFASSWISWFLLNFFLLWHILQPVFSSDPFFPLPIMDILHFCCHFVSVSIPDVLWDLHFSWKSLLHILFNPLTLVLLNWLILFLVDLWLLSFSMHWNWSFSPDRHLFFSISVLMSMPVDSWHPVESFRTFSQSSSSFPSPVFLFFLFFVLTFLQIFLLLDVFLSSFYILTYFLFLSSSYVCLLLFGFLCRSPHLLPVFLACFSLFLVFCICFLPCSFLIQSFLFIFFLLSARTLRFLHLLQWLGSKDRLKLWSHLLHEPQRSHDTLASSPRILSSRSMSNQKADLRRIRLLGDFAISRSHIRRKSQGPSNVLISPPWILGSHGLLHSTIWRVGDHWHKFFLGHPPTAGHTSPSCCSGSGTYTSISATVSSFMRGLKNVPVSVSTGIG